MKKIALGIIMASVVMVGANAAPSDIASVGYVDRADGNRTYTEQNYVSSGQSLTASVDALDMALAGIDTNAALDNILDGTNITITDGTGADAGKIIISAPATGLVADGNTGLVDGNAVYDAIAANIANIVGEGYVSVADGTGANEGKKVITVNVSGAVAEDNTGLVTGGTVWTAIQNAIEASLIPLTSTTADTITAGYNTTTGEYEVGAITGEIGDAADAKKLATVGNVQAAIGAEATARATADGDLDFTGTNADGATDLTGAIIALDNAIDAATLTGGTNIEVDTDGNINTLAPATTCAATLSAAGFTSAQARCNLTMNETTGAFQWDIVVL